MRQQHVASVDTAFNVPILTEKLPNGLYEVMIQGVNQQQPIRWVKE